MDQQHRRNKPTVGYQLFLYKNELARSNAKKSLLSRTKLRITDALVSRTIKRLKHCDVEELQACKRGLHYKEQLKAQLSHPSRNARNMTTVKASPKAIRRTTVPSKAMIVGKEIFV